MRSLHWWVPLFVLCGCGKKDDQPAQPPEKTPPPSAPVDAAVVTKARSPDAAVPAAPPPDAAAPPPDAAAAAPEKPDPTAATKAAFPELLDEKKRFVFEVVEGRRIDSLKPRKGTPRVIGTIEDPTVDGGYTMVFLKMKPEAGMPMGLGATARQLLRIVFYEDGIRQLAAIGASSSAKDNIRGFTFPNTLDKPITIEGRPDFGTATINLKRAKLVLGGKKQDVMLAETKLFERGFKATTYETMAYAPGLGPALLCVADEKNAPLSCLRLVATE